MTTDRYTKAILTVIAIALSIIAFQEAIPEAIAIGGSCGSIIEPCFVTTQPDDPLYVTSR